MATKYKAPANNGPAESGNVRIIETGQPDYLAIVRATMSNEKAAELSRFASQAPPGASADAILAAYRAQIAPDTDQMDQVVQAVDGRLAPKPVKQPTPTQPVVPEDDTTGFLNESFEALKGVSRSVLAVASLPGEMIKGGIEGTLGQVAGRNNVDGPYLDKDAFEATSAYNLFTNWQNQGSGWFIGDQAAEAQATQRTDLLYRDVEVTDPETGATSTQRIPSSIGSEVASPLEYGSTPYQWASGVVDLVAAVGTDPLTYVTLGASGVGKAGRVARFTEAKGEAAGIGRAGKKAEDVQAALDLEAKAQKAYDDILAAGEKAAAKDAEVEALMDARLAEVAQAAAKGLPVEEQVAKITEILGEAADVRLRDLDPEQVQNLSNLYRSAAAVDDPAHAAIAQEITDALEEAAREAKPGPGPGVRRAEAQAGKVTSKENEAAAAAREVEKAAKAAAMQAKLQQAAVTQARKAFEALSAARKTADEVTAKVISGEEAVLLTKVHSMIRGEIRADDLTEAASVMIRDFASDVEGLGSLADEAPELSGFLDNLSTTLDKVARFRDVDTVAAAGKTTAAEKELAKAAEKMTEQVNKLRTVYGLEDETAKLLNGDSAPLKQVLQESLGAADYGQIDWEKFSGALFGSKAGKATVKLLAQETDALKIWRATGRKLHIDIARKIASATNEDEVLDALAKSMGGRNGIAAPLTGFGMRTYRASVPKSTKVWANKVAGINEAAFRTYSGAQKVVPWSHELHLEDTQSVVEALDDWLGMAFVQKSRRKLGRDEARTLSDDILRGVVDAEDMFARREAVRSGLMTAVGKMGEAYGVEDTSEFMVGFKKAIDNAFQTQARANGGKGDYFTVASALDPSGTAKLDTLNGVNLLDKDVVRHTYQLSEFFRLPDVREVQTLLRKGKKFTDEGGAVADYLTDFAEHGVDKLFRTAVLAFRPAYIIRNFGEASFRQFLNGSLHDPVTILSLVTRHSKDRRFLANWEPYTHDILDNTFLSRMDTADFNSTLGVLDDDIRGSIWRTHSVMDPGFQRQVSMRQGEVLEPGMDNFMRAWKHQLHTLRGDKVSTDVVSVMHGEPTKRISQYMKSIGEADPVEAAIRYYSDGPGKAIFERMAVERPTHWGRMLDSAGRTNEDEIVSALREGRWSVDRDTMAQVLFAHNGSFYNEASRYLANLDPELTKAWLARDFDEVAGKMGGRDDILPPRVWWGGSAAKAGPSEGVLTQAVDKFFHYAAITDGAINWGPETRWSYWQRVEDLFPYLTKKDQEAVLKLADKSLSPLRMGGKAVGANKQSRLYKRLEAGPTSKSGMLTREDVHAMAAQHAARETAALFYDGYKKKQYWYASRLAFPFGQAWANTLSTWGRLAASPKGAVRVYSMAKGYDYLSGGYTSPSQVEKYREMRPVLFNDPQTGQAVFQVPIVGELLDLFGLPADVVAPLASANVATGGGGLPGLGPVITIPAKLMFNMSDMESVTPKWVQKWVDPFPSGVPEEPAEMTYRSFMPAWARRIAAWTDFDGSSKEIQSMLPGITTYLATKNQDAYLNEAGVFDEAGRQKLADDAVKAARYTSLYRGFVQSSLPVTAMYRWMLETGDDTPYPQADAYIDFERMMNLNDQDFSAALKEFEDTFGPGAGLMLVSKYKGEFPTTSKAAVFFDEHPTDLGWTQSGGLFFPKDGTYSAEFDRTLRGRDLKEQLGPEERMVLANNRRFFLIKDNLDYKVETGQMTEEQAKEEVDRLKVEFDVVYDDSLSIDREAQLREVREILASDSALTGTEAGVAAAEYLSLRDQALARVRADLGVDNATLGRKEAADIRRWLYDSGTQLTETYPDFQRMWQALFEREVA